MARATAARMTRPVRTAIRRGAARWPEASFAAASILARATHGLGRGLDADSIRLVFPDLPQYELELARRDTWSAALRASVLEAALSVPGAEWPYPRLLSGPDPAQIRPPAVLATMHY